VTHAHYVRCRRGRHWRSHRPAFSVKTSSSSSSSSSSSTHSRTCTNTHPALLAAGGATSDVSVTALTPMRENMRIDWRVLISAVWPSISLFVVIKKSNAGHTHRSCRSACQSYIQSHRSNPYAPRQSERVLVGDRRYARTHHLCHTNASHAHVLTPTSNTTSALAMPRSRSSRRESRAVCTCTTSTRYHARIRHAHVVLRQQNLQRHAIAAVGCACSRYADTCVSTAPTPHTTTYARARLYL
jgi:hypothetical protein